MTRTWIDTTDGEVIELTCADSSLSRLQARAVLAERFLGYVGDTLPQWREVTEAEQASFFWRGVLGQDAAFFLSVGSTQFLAAKVS